MLIFLLFSDQISGGGGQNLRGKKPARRYMSETFVESSEGVRNVDSSAQEIRIPESLGHTGNFLCY